MRLHQLSCYEYCVSGMEGWAMSQALRLWKAKFETPKHFLRDVITHPALEELGRFVIEMWDGIEPVSVQEALKEQNLEKRRVMFDCIGVEKLFSELQPELLDRQVLQKKRVRWDERNQPYDHCFEDTYELYRIDGHKLFDTPNAQPVYAVKCQCTTTARQYWIYVSPAAALGNRTWAGNQEPDAIRAIAWTLRIDVTHPKRIYRQGDIVAVEESVDSQPTTPYHLSKEQYLSLLYSET